MKPLVMSQVNLTFVKLFCNYKRNSLTTVFMKKATSMDHMSSCNFKIYHLSLSIFEVKLLEQKHIVLGMRIFMWSLQNESQAVGFRGNDGFRYCDSEMTETKNICHGLLQPYWSKFIWQKFFFCSTFQQSLRVAGSFDYGTPIYETKCCFTSPIHHLVSIPKCIVWYVQCRLWQI